MATGITAQSSTNFSLKTKAEIKIKQSNISCYSESRASKGIVGKFLGALGSGRRKCQSFILLSSLHFLPQNVLQPQWDGFQFLLIEQCDVCPVSHTFSLYAFENTRRTCRWKTPSLVTSGFQKTVQRKPSSGICATQNINKEENWAYLLVWLSHLNWL